MSVVNLYGNYVGGLLIRIMKKWVKFQIKKNKYIISVISEAMGVHALYIFRKRIIGVKDQLI